MSASAEAHIHVLSEISHGRPELKMGGLEVGAVIESWLAVVAELEGSIWRDVRGPMQ